MISMKQFRWEAQLDGINVLLEIENYVPKKYREDLEWCRVHISIQQDFEKQRGDGHIRQKISYDQVGEILLCDEVEYLARWLKKLIDSGADEHDTIRFCEPDLEFKGYNVHSSITAQKHVPQVEMTINLWDEDGALTANGITVALGEKEIRSLNEALNTPVH